MTLRLLDEQHHDPLARPAVPGVLEVLRPDAHHLTELPRDEAPAPSPIVCHVLDDVGELQAEAEARG